ncbi:MBL fold metallo-hydrolase [Candidatus Formimonas warabiya]|uniref:MBL fold metallo-hydrolase n=1 Tax=Formimonas warabiya TaxID=1761012 RepID=UPI001BE40DC3|nr:MBL fold metallo-hydrolase [Candidatus Formimonas warabiya]
MKNIRATVLVNNSVYLPNLGAEHGWSILIETGDGSILFDTGQSDLLFRNAKILNCDLEKVEKAVLSHGHYDHTGGLSSFLSLNPGTTVFAHPDVFKRRFSIKPGKLPRDISMPVLDQKQQSNFYITSQPAPVLDHVFTTGEIPRQFDIGGINKGLFCDPEGKNTDSVWDDQALVMHTPKGIVVLMGCCHAGVENTLETVAGLTGEKKFYMVLGGMHLSEAPEDRLQETVRCLHRFQVQKVGPAHCTGWRGREVLARLFSGEVFSCDVGNVIQLN